MKPVYQKNINHGMGDCMQAVIASLFEKELDEVPKFIEFGDRWWSELRKYFMKNGYSCTGYFHNKNYQSFLNPTYQCFNKEMFDKRQILSKNNLKKWTGVNGFFFASVLSPKYFTYKEKGFPVQHAVVIDKGFNIVHDPNPGYANILSYPLSDFLKFNGILEVLKINKL
jgi:hypothetical protein